MKKMALTTMLTAFLSIVQANLSADCCCICPIVQVGQLTPEMLEIFRSGETSNMVLEIPEGTRLPLQFFLSGDVFTMENADQPPVLTVLRTIYVKRDGQHLLFSVDFEEWKGFLSIFTGIVGFTLDVNTEQPALNIHGKVNARDDHPMLY